MDRSRIPAVLGGGQPDATRSRFFVAHGVHGFLVLGSVVLCITGGEALYADMGHFGRRPIRIAWYAVVFPALLLNYFGQGALLLARRTGARRPRRASSPPGPFYALVPGPALSARRDRHRRRRRRVAGADLGRVLADPAGGPARLLAARRRSCTPRATTEGQIYVPEVNCALMVACVALVLDRSRPRRSLAAAYGIAVTGTMTITSLLFFVVARRRWHWSPLRAGALAGVFLVVDLSFFGANLVKIADGGWFPLVGGLGVFTRDDDLEDAARGAVGDSLAEVRCRSTTVPARVWRMQHAASRRRHRGLHDLELRGTPPVLLHHFKHNKVLHEQVDPAVDRVARSRRGSRRGARSTSSTLGHGF